MHTLLDPDRESLACSLAQFAILSAASDAALLYTTGHGVQVNEAVYLLPGDYPFDQGERALNTSGIPLGSLTSMLRARVVNLAFYGGCRNDPF